MSLCLCHVVSLVFDGVISLVQTVLLCYFEDRVLGFIDPSTDFKLSLACESKVLISEDDFNKQLYAHVGVQNVGIS
ncbi:hypothetical protein TSUD_307050 [Trifolium subterraneum]|uniref:Uncharacterized protein n=1 Tax=Trifolium subterraneum TaxID=3900 RepID=A0A2Z6PBW0_TRISU|nr:hypothetical protein TSUD_307050 [Trifolium subterraneum]